MRNSSGYDRIVSNEYSIVAVHGLGGDAWNTWTWTDHESTKMWLEDFLPAAVPNSRIMTFGYDSAVAFSKSVSGIEGFAKQLLYRLQFMRESKDRPIIFICHSLGGIVVKKVKPEIYPSSIPLLY